MLRLMCNLAIQVNFYPGFLSVDPDEADVKAVADHIDHIARVAGRAQYASPSIFTPSYVELSRYTAVVALGSGVTTTASIAALADWKTCRTTQPSCVLPRFFLR